MWDQRYAQSEYVYRTNPNEFFKKELANLTPGKILLPAEGEGRNAAYAAEKGWTVSAFDQSEEGRKKALLFSEVELMEDFSELQIISIGKNETMIQEGAFYKSNASVIQLVASK